MKFVSCTLLLLVLAGCENGTGTEPASIPIPYNPDSQLERIVGGVEVAESDFEAFVQVHPNGRCGGSLIHSDIVLTSAQCRVVVGQIVYVKGTGSGSTMLDGGIGRSVTMNIEHPSYHEADPDLPFGDSYRYDFRILKLSTPVEGVTPVTLATSTATPSTLIWIGYGRTCSNCAFSSTLLETSTNGVGVNACRTWFSPWIIDDNIHICSENDPGQSDCDGDTGGPIFSAATGEQYGVTSFGGECFDEDYSVGARVTGVSSWIESQICAHSQLPPSSCSETPQTESPTTAGLFTQFPTATPSAAATISSSPTTLPTVGETFAPTRSPTCNGLTITVIVLGVAAFICFPFAPFIILALGIIGLVVRFTDPCDAYQRQ